MISGPGSYTLSDFLLFSPETYFRLFELYNQTVFPLQLLTVGAGLWCLRRVRRVDARSGRIIAVLLAFSWLWVAWAFHWQRYAAINWAAVYFAVLFAVEALLIIWFGVVRNLFVFPARRDWLYRAGFAVLGFSVTVQPLLGLIAGRSWSQLSFFGLGPDPTATATFGVILMLQERFRYLLLLPVLLWCAISTLTALAMETLEYSVPVILLLFAACMAARKVFDSLTQ